MRYFASQDAERESALEAVRRMFESRISRRPLLQTLSLVGPDGAVLASSRKDGNAINVSSRDYFRKAMSGEVAISDVFASGIDGNPIFVVAAPVRVSGRIAGVVYSAVKLQGLSEGAVSRVKVGKRGYAFIADAKGRVLAHPRRDLIMKLDLSTMEWGREMLGKDAGVVRYLFEGQEKIVAFEREPVTRWMVGVTAEQSDIFDSIVSIRNRSALAAGVVLLCIVGVVVFVVRGISQALGEGVRFATDVAAGDLSRDINLNRNDELGQLASALTTMVKRLREMIATAEQKTSEAEAQSLAAQEATRVAEEARRQAEGARREGLLDAAGRLEGIVMRVTSASEQLAAQVEQSSRGADLQRERSAEAATAMEEMTATVIEVARNASEASESADKARQQATDGAGVVLSMVEAIGTVDAQTGELRGSLGTLGERAEGIGQIMTVISDIADQTNLLALNAAIEAARAGDAGRGFAVVADEVRKLAEKTMNATREVGEAVRAIQNGTRDSIAGMEQASMSVGRSNELAGLAGAALQRIVTFVEASADQVRSIATASEEQSAASEQISRGTEEVNRIAAETADAMRQSAQAVTELAAMAQELQQLIERLKQG
ncbi:methyl-accepting chemotaxis protein [Nitratidesulfovibrio vulgaris]|uniref:methyl-accepting chemotaxis protein n=1 Tax=Nitratidesulfovibrio vulgaris TaxID=881 RepID=UPI0023012FCB|nr:methyl-accepting chemotaxis protein [Nitratidesulfovibrio vulgaris]WCB46198.1 methyl-accepting chemotaxis protein [Nitratidesulfovibrio vulgaris]